MRNKQETFLVDAADYRGVLQHVDEARIKDAFIGIWPSRDDFGQHWRCRSGSNRTSGSTAPRSSATWSGTVYTCSRM